MILLILFWIVALFIFAIAILMSVEEFDSLWGIIPGIIAGAFFSAIAFLIYSVIGSIVTYNSATEWSDGAKIVELRALDTGNQAEGSFFLGSGYLKERPAYTYITRSDEGGFSLGSMYASKALVFETTDGSKPRLKTGNIQPISHLWSIVSVDAMAEFYVPAGSVQAPKYNVSTERD